MKKILVLGAGHSATYLIDWILERSPRKDWFLTVADRDGEVAARTIADHQRGQSLVLDATDASFMATHVDQADVVVNMLPQAFQERLAIECLHLRTPMVSVSYADRAIHALDLEAQRLGVLLLAEIGLDPGIDHMGAMRMIRAAHDAGAEVESFESYGSGVPAPDEVTNPLRYCITWNPRNVVMAGEHGAQYLQNGELRIVPWHRLFESSWPKVIPGVGRMEAYPNRDSLSYRDIFGIPEAKTLIRGTLRHPGWSETWHQIVRLGLPNEQLGIPDLATRSPAEIVDMFLPRSLPGITVEERTAKLLRLSPTGRVMETLRWLGLFDEEPCGIQADTAAGFMVGLLSQKLPLPDDARDLVILHHELIAAHPDGRRELLRSTFTRYGRPGGPTAMAETVGLPAGLAVQLILDDELPLSGVCLPTHPAIGEPILTALEAAGMQLDESTELL